MTTLRDHANFFVDFINEVLSKLDGDPEPVYTLINNIG